MESGIRTLTPPDGPPRFAAVFDHPDNGWHLAVEGSSREPVDYAVAEMITTVQARGQSSSFEMWGPTPDGREWQHLGSLTRGPGKSAPGEARTEQPQRSARTARLLDRRHQVLTSALSGAGLDITESEDGDAVSRMVEALDEETVRRVGYWLGQANT